MKEEKEFVITPSMKAAQEKLDNMTPEELEARRAASREKLRRFYSGWGRIRPAEETNQHE